MKEINNSSSRKKIIENLNKIVDHRKEKVYPLYYTVGDRVHYNDIEAYKDFSQNLNDPIYFNFGMDMFSDDEPDWTKEPPHEIEYYRQEICAYIEDTYDEIVVGYSGGTDSETMCDAFKRRGTKNIHFLHTALKQHYGSKDKQQLWDHMRKSIKAKHNDAIRDLKWKFTIAEPWEPNAPEQFANSLQDHKIGAFNVDYKPHSTWSQNSGKMVIPVIGKRKVLVMGKEKPEIVIHNGWWCFHMTNQSHELPLSAMDPGIDVFMFFFNDVCPDLIKKLAWTKAKEMQKVFFEQGLEPNRENSMRMSSTDSLHYLRLIEKMEYKAISDFLHSGTTKLDGNWYTQFSKNVIEADQGMTTKKHLTDVFFENEIIGNIDSRFLDTKNKTLVGICSKPIPLFPVDERLFRGQEKSFK
jgi:hypothetical protein